MKKRTYAVTTVFMTIVIVAMLAVFLVRVKGLESQLDALKDAADQVDEMESRLAESEAYVSAVRTERDAVNGVLDGVRSERDAANEIAEAAKAERDIVYKRLSEAYARIIELETELGVEPTTAPYVIEPADEAAEATATVEPTATEKAKATATAEPTATEKAKATATATAEPTATAKPKMTVEVMATATAAK